MQTQEVKYEKITFQKIELSQIKEWISNSQNYKNWLNKQPDPLAALNATLINLKDHLKNPSQLQTVSIDDIPKFIGWLINLLNEKLNSTNKTPVSQVPSAIWKDWLAWVEEVLIAAPTVTNASQLLMGFANLAENYYFIRPFKADTINNLLKGLLKSGSLEEIRDGLKGLRTLIDYQGVWGIRNIDVNILSALLACDPQNEKKGKDTKIGGSAKKTAEITIRAHIANHIAYIVPLINMLLLSSVSKPINLKDLPTISKPINLKDLQTMLDLALRSPDKPGSSLCQLLLAGGKLLQAGGQKVDSILREQISKILTLLDKECISDNPRMNISDVALALYALVLPAEAGWLNLKPTKNLVKLFHEWLAEELLKPNTEKELSDLQTRIVKQNVAEYLCLTHKPLTQPIIDYLKEKRPIDEESLQHQFGLYLKKQDWFNSRYEITDEEVRKKGYAEIDYIIFDKKTGKYFNMEVDGIFHLSHLAQNARRDDYLCKSKELPILAAIIRIPVPKNVLTREKTLKLMEVQLKEDLSKPLAPSPTLGKSKKIEIKSKKSPPPKMVALPEESLPSPDIRIFIPDVPVEKKEEVKHEEISVQQLRNAIQSYDCTKANGLVNKLKLQNKFKSPQGKANVLLQAVNAAAIAGDENEINSKTIIESLVSAFGHSLITTANSLGQSPLQRAIELNNKKIVDLFINLITPKKFKKTPRPDFYPQWQKALEQAEKEKKTDIVQLLSVKANIHLPKINRPSNAPLTGHTIPATTPKPGAFDQKTILSETHTDLNDDKTATSLSNRAAELCKNQQSDPDWLEQLELMAETDYPQAQYIASNYFSILGDSKLEFITKRVKLLSKAVEQGIPEAQFDLGVHYDQGIGVQKNVQEAAKWFRKAAEHGDAHAQYSLGVCYTTGKGVTKDAVEAVKWFQKAAEQGIADAQYTLWMCYETGEGVTKNTKKAAKWQRKAAEQGHVVAQHNLGRSYIFGEGVTKDAAEGVKWYRKAAEQGHVKAQYCLGVCYTTGEGVTKEDAVEGTKWFLKAAEQGDAKAQLNLGSHYSTGTGVTKDAAKAESWFRKAAEQGSAKAQYMLGEHYHESQNFIEAAKCFQKAALQNYAPAQNDLGYYYLAGEGVSQDFTEAMKLFQEAASQNFAEAKYYLGVCYGNGMGINQDPNQAVKNFLEAVELFPEHLKSYPKAIKVYAVTLHHLGMCYEKGIGVQRNADQAEKCYKRAAGLGNLEAKAKLKDYPLPRAGVNKDEKLSRSFGAIAPKLGGSPIHRKKQPPSSPPSSNTPSFQRGGL